MIVTVDEAEEDKILQGSVVTQTTLGGLCLPADDFP